jgi:long-subunit fatty acid transport protein
VGLNYQLSPHAAVFAGTSYDMAPVTEKYRTFDAPTDEQIRMSGSYVYQRQKLRYSLGASVIHAGDGKVDQTVEVTPGSGLFARTKGQFSSYYLVFVSASVEYRF